MFETDRRVLYQTHYYTVYICIRYLKWCRCGNLSIHREFVGLISPQIRFACFQDHSAMLDSLLAISALVADLDPLMTHVVCFPSLSVARRMSLQQSTCPIHCSWFEFRLQHRQTLWDLFSLPYVFWYRRNVTLGRRRKLAVALGDSVSQYT